MNFEKGYIAIANKQWCDICYANKQTFVNIWTRKPTFKAVSTGSPVFVLEKGSRLIRGFGILKRFEIKSVLETWENYHISNGATRYDEFLKSLNLINNEKAEQHKLGNILVENVVWCNSKLPIDTSSVYFHKAIVSGKTISKEEALQLINLITQEKAP